MSRGATPGIKVVWLLGILIFALMVGTPLTPTAEAAFKGCRSDPVVILSDGTTLDVSASIGTDVSNVREIHYTVHGPAQVTLVSVVRTPILGFTGKETFTYIDDAQPGEYITETLVRTIDNPVLVTAYTTFAKATLLSNISLTVQYQPVTGYNEQTLRYVIRR